MKGQWRIISPARRFVIDLMRVSVPLIVVERAMALAPVLAARAALAERPAVTALLLKAFAIVAQEEPALRRFFLRWPWPHYYEIPVSIGFLIVERHDIERNAVFGLKIGAIDGLPLAEIDRRVREGKTAPVAAVPSLQRLMTVARLPGFLRHRLWDLALAVGRLRANHFGSFAISSVGALGIHHVVSRAPGPSLLTYGPIAPDGSLIVQLQWDHRIYDAALAAIALQRIEAALNGPIRDELLALAAA